MRSPPVGDKPAATAPPRQSLLPNLLLSLGVSVVFLGGLEGICRVLERIRPAPKVAFYIWDWEERWDGDFYTVGPPGTGWPPWEEFNSDGVRDRAHPVEKLDETWRVVFLGDSVTMGAGLDPKDAYPQLLEAALKVQGRRVEVFNVALWGWSTRQERIAYERIARKYRPDQVVLAVCLNDIPELQNNLSRPPPLLAELHRRSALVRRIVNASGREIQSVEELLVDKDRKQVKEGLDRFFAEVRTLRRQVQGDGASFSLIVFPFRLQLDPSAPPPSPQQAIASFCAAEGLRCLDLLPRIRREGEGAFLDYDHLNPGGTRVVADEILSSGLLQARPSLAEILEAHHAATPAALLSALRQPDPALRTAAAWGIARTGPAAREALAPLVETLKTDARREVRAEAARSIGARGQAARPAIPALFEALRDESQNVRWRAAQALWKAGLTAPQDVPSLIECLKNADPYVRGFAAWTLGNMGPAAKEAIPALIEALGSDDAYLRGGAALALAKMGSVAKEAVPSLLEGLKSPDHQRRRNAARALGRIGPEARAAVPTLMAALKDPDARVRLQVARALGRIGPEAKDALPALSAAKEDAESSVRREVEDALRKIRK